MTIRSMLEELLADTARRDALDARIKTLRGELEAELTARLEADGAVPSVKAGGLGSATLAAADPERPSYKITVVDEAALTAWVAERFPSEVETVTRVRPAFLGAITEGAKVLPDGSCMTDDGELLAGVAGQRRNPYLSVRLDREAKDRARAELEAERAPVGECLPSEPDHKPAEVLACPACGGEHQVTNRALGGVPVIACPNVPVDRILVDPGRLVDPDLAPYELGE